MTLKRTMIFPASILLSVGLYGGCRNEPAADAPESTVTVVKAEDEEPTPPVVLAPQEQAATTAAEGNPKPAPSPGANAKGKATDAGSPSGPQIAASQAKPSQKGNNGQGTATSPPQKPAPKTAVPVPPKAVKKIQAAATPVPPSRAEKQKPSAMSKAPLVVVAEVVTPSRIPEPASVPYKDVLTFIKYRVASVERGSYGEKEILVAHWGMKDGKHAPAARYKEGDRVTLTLEPLDQHPELSQVMQADDTNAFELTPYWATDASR